MFDDSRDTIRIEVAQGLAVAVVRLEGAGLVRPERTMLPKPGGVGAGFPPDVDVVGVDEPLEPPPQAASIAAIIATHIVLTHSRLEASQAVPPLDVKCTLTTPDRGKSGCIRDSD